MGHGRFHYGAAIGIGIMVLVAIVVVGILARASESALPVGHAGEGMYVFEESCTSCHGIYADGTENGPTLLTPALKPPAMTRDDIADVIEHGSGLMPAFEAMTRQEQADAITYLMVLQAYEGH